MVLRRQVSQCRDGQIMEDPAIPVNLTRVCRVLLADPAPERP